ncbi:iron-containing redox enzyme family protein [Oxalobacteraceae bacterium A2-2]
MSTSNLASALPQRAAAPAAQTQHGAAASAKEVYLFLQGEPDELRRAAARAYLRREIDAARACAIDLPQDPAALSTWSARHADAVGQAYSAYLRERRAGSPRRYFGNLSHARYFLRAVAPTKLVDGAWLYGCLAHWDDPDFRPLIQTYLEELGNGVPDKNHVVLYKKLLADHDCAHWDDLSDAHFVQGAIQLALGWNARHFLPEIIGYNLGYEQLPLHLLITAYELNELGVDPMYFTLHVTVDNAGTGHAHKAIEALRQLLVQHGDEPDFMRRVMDGYRLNELGAGTTSVIAEFDLETELVRILSDKAAVGKNMHSDYCRVAGRSINDWLSDRAQIPAMLSALEAAGWIKRGVAPEHSRFWRLIQGERAEMFGVFSAYEQQVLADWIASTRDGAGSAQSPRVASHRARMRALDALGDGPPPRQHDGRLRGIIRRRYEDGEASLAAGGSALYQLEQQVAAQGSKRAAMELLQTQMSPARHHGARGLMATRLFCQLLDCA